MSEKQSQTMRESYLDAAAAEAVGANTAAESAAFARETESASTGEKTAAGQMREVSARLSAASPYMEPPADLRAKILAATAPATFNMDDYRKATREDTRFWRYGLIAATLFLVAAAYWNMNLQSTVGKKDAELARLRGAIGEQNTALSMIVNPGTEKMALRSGEKAIGWAVLDSKAKTAVVIMPREMYAANKVPQFSITTPSGEKQEYHTISIAVGTPAEPGTDMTKGVLAQPLGPTSDSPRPAGLMRP